MDASTENHKSGETSEEVLASSFSSEEPNTEVISTSNIAAPPIPPPPPPAPGQQTVVLPIKIPDVSDKTLKLKPCHWKKVETYSGTIWEKIHKLEDSIKVDYRTVEKKFYCPENSFLNTGKRKKHLLDDKHTTIIEVLLKKYESPLDVIKIIKNGTTDQLDLNHYEDILKILENDHLAKRLGEYNGDLKKLDSADHLMVELVKIPDLKSWIKFIIAKGELLEICDVRENLLNIRIACETIKESSAFHYFLRYTYHTGLFLNKGKPVGNTFGYKISSIKTFADIKSPEEPHHSLLEYMMRDIEKQDKSHHLEFVSDFIDKLPSCTMGKTSETVQEMEQKMANLEKISSTIPSSSSTWKQCQETVEEVQNKVSIIREEFRQISKMTAETLQYFAEDTRKQNIDELFQDFKEMCEKMKHIQDKMAHTKVIQEQRRMSKQFSSVLEQLKRRGRNSSTSHT